MKSRILPVTVLLACMIAWGVNTYRVDLGAVEPDAGDASRGPNERFYSVADHLDQGGSFYLYVDTKDILRNLVQEVAKFLPQAAPPGDATETYDKVSRGLELSGLYDVTDLGFSSVTHRSMTTQKVFVGLPPERTGIFGILGRAPHSFESLGYAPADSVLFRTMDLDLAAALSLAREIMKTFMGPAGPALIDQQVENMGEALGISVEQILHSLDGEFAVVAELDSARSLTLPMTPPGDTQMPAPRLAFLIKCKDFSLYNSIRAGLSSREMIEKETNTDTLKQISIKVEPSEAYPMDPVLAFDGIYVILASHREYMDSVLAAKNGGPNLSSNPEFREFMAGLPEKGNGLMFISKGLAEAVQPVVAGMSEMQASEAGVPFTAPAWLSKPSAVGFVRVNGADGILIASNSEFSGIEALLASIAGSVAALPAAVGGVQTEVVRTGADLSRIEAEMQALSLALETYYVDHNIYPPAVDENGKPGTVRMDGSVISSGFVPWMLTSPVAYVSEVPVDPYNRRDDGTNAPFRYSTNGASCWIATSHGPDGDADVKVEEFADPEKGKCSWNFFAEHLGFGDAVQYDPSNGTLSSGDIMQVGP